MDGAPSREGLGSQDGEEQEAQRQKPEQPAGHEHRGGRHRFDDKACAPAARVAADRRAREASAAAIAAAPDRVRAVEPRWTTSPEESESWDATTVALCRLMGAFAK